MQAGSVDPANCICASYCPEATPPKNNGDILRCLDNFGLAQVLSAFGRCVPNSNKALCDDNCEKCWKSWLDSANGVKEEI